MNSPFRHAVLPAFLVAATVASTTVPAVAAERAHPALWTMSDEDTTITLFGTMHVMHPDVDWFHGDVREAFDASDEVVLETLSLSPADEQALIMRYGVDDSGRRLRSRLAPDERMRYEHALRSLGFPPDALDPFKPWMAAVTLSVVPMLQAGYTPELGVDEVLERAAGRTGKTLTGLETAELQLGLLDAIEEPLQLDMLNATIAEVDEIRFAVREMGALWSRGRAEELGVMVQDMMTGHEDDGALHEALLAVRNRAWAEWIEERMARPGKVFLAVGAAHLVGADSLPTLLGETGYAVTRVRPDVASAE